MIRKKRTNLYVLLFSKNKFCRFIISTLSSTLTSVYVSFEEDAADEERSADEELSADEERSADVVSALSSALFSALSPVKLPCSAFCVLGFCASLEVFPLSALLFVAELLSAVSVSAVPLDACYGVILSTMVSISLREPPEAAAINSVISPSIFEAFLLELFPSRIVLDKATPGINSTKPPSL